MKPVFQSIVDQDHGDCFRCCIASILEVEADAVPNFVAVERDDFHVYDRWCAENGIALIEIGGRGYPEPPSPLSLFRWDWARGVFCIASLPSQRFPGGWHAVVAQMAPDPEYPQDAVKLRIAHDPNPDNGPYSADEIAKIRTLVFLVPFIPQRSEAS